MSTATTTAAHYSHRIADLLSSRQHAHHRKTPPLHCCGDAQSLQNVVGVVVATAPGFVPAYALLPLNGWRKPRGKHAVRARRCINQACTRMRLDRTRGQERAPHKEMCHFESCSMRNEQ